MSDSRKEFEDAVRAQFDGVGEFTFARGPDGYYNSVHSRTFGGRKQAEHAPVQMLYEMWFAALSVAPAPVAAVWVDTAHLRELTVDRDGEGLPDGIETMLFREPPNEYPWTPLYTSPPVQEGPKGVEALAKFDALLVELADATYGYFTGGQRPELWHLAMQEAERALRAYFKQCTAQSIPAAPCQRKPDETTGWTDDDIMVPRCNVCGLVVMKVIAERKAERLLAGN